MHVHSNYSDGKLPPEEILKHAIENRIDVLSLTDHDTIEGTAEMVRLSRQEPYHGKITIIPGVEISAKDKNGVGFHVLAYGFDVEDPAFVEKFKLISEKKLFNSLRTYQVLKEELPQRKFALVDNQLKDMAENGNLSKEKAYQFLGKNQINFSDQKMHIDKKLESTNEKSVSFELICKHFAPELESGKMVLSLAHPTIYFSDLLSKNKHKTKPQVEEIFVDSLKNLKVQGVNFLENYHKFEKDNARIDQLNQYAKEIGFGISGGVTDAHVAYQYLGKRSDGTSMAYCNILDKLLPEEQVQQIKMDAGVKGNESVILVEDPTRKAEYEKEEAARQREKQQKEKQQQEKQQQESMIDQEQHALLEEENKLARTLEALEKIESIKNGTSNLTPKAQKNILQNEEKVLTDLKSFDLEPSQATEMLKEHRSKSQMDLKGALKSIASLLLKNNNLALD